MSLDPQLVIMAKTPLIGRVKTRLARDVGGVEALRFFSRGEHGADPARRQRSALADPAGAGARPGGA